MSKKDPGWKAAAKAAFPDLPPSRAGGFAVSDDGKTVMITGIDVSVCIVLAHPTDRSRLRSMLRSDADSSPDYTRRVGDKLYLAPPEPLLHKCPTCTAGETEGVANRKKKGIRGIPAKIWRLTFLHSFCEQWGSVVTRHDVYRCRGCRWRWVSTNGREPEIAAPGM